MTVIVTSCFLWDGERHTASLLVAHLTIIMGFFFTSGGESLQLWTVRNQVHLSKWSHQAQKAQSVPQENHHSWGWDDHQETLKDFCRFFFKPQCPGRQQKRSSKAHQKIGGTSSSSLNFITPHSTIHRVCFLRAIHYSRTSCSIKLCQWYSSSSK